MLLEPTYHLEGIIRSKEEIEDFEGPLTLILMLLSKNRIEIRDIQISEILEQYLAYLEEMKAMDLEIASEFVQMAAHLIYIKTKMLLTNETEEVSELEALIASLEQLKARDTYAAIKEVTPTLSAASERGSLYRTKLPEPLPGVREYRYQHEGWELLQALSQVLRRSVRSAAEDENGEGAARRKRLIPKRITYNVRDKSREILLRLKGAERVSLPEFYRTSRSRSEVVATFLSVLELCSVGYAALEHEGSEVYVRFTGGEMEQILEQIGKGIGLDENG